MCGNVHGLRSILDGRASLWKARLALALTRDAPTPPRRAAFGPPVPYHPPKRSRNNRFTSAGLAWPRVSFMTWPTKCPKSAVLPARYWSA